MPTRPLLALLLAAAAVLAALAAAPAAEAAFPGRNGVIAYQSTASARGVFLARRASGRGLQRLIPGGHVSDPTFSATGRRLAFARDGAIWSMYLDGAVLRRMTLSPLPEGHPSWSPAGDQVAFERGRRGHRRLFAVGSDGLSQRQLSFRGPDDHAPAWSARGQIAFVRPSRHRGQDLWVMDGPGQVPRRLTRAKPDEEAPAWSPDGRRLAFVRGPAARAELVVMDADGRHERRLTRHVGAASPAWSPDGRRIAYSAGPHGRRQVFVLRARGGQVRQLTRGRTDALAPAWQPTGGDPVIAAAGDIACDPTNREFGGGLGSARNCHQQQTSDVLLGLDLAAVLMLGDAQYPNGAYSDFLAGYGPSWGRLKGLTRPVPGNHEYGTPGAAGYFDYFDGVGKATGVAGGRDRGYYGFDVGTWHVVALNSNCGSLPGGCAAGSPQEQWLRADLAAHPAACTLAFWHHPLFASAEEGETPATRPLWQALYDAGADVVLNGHAHAYERFGPQTADAAADPARGIREFVVGTGGRNLQGFRAIRPNSEVRSRGSYGVLAMTLHPTGYDWRFLTALGRGSFTDRGTAACH